MTDVFCIALVFNRSSYRYRTYALQYARVLLELDKMVLIYSPDWIWVNEQLSIQFPWKASKFRCFPLETEPHSGFAATALEWYSMTRKLRQAEKILETQVDLVYFCPIDEWIAPATGRSIFDSLFPFNWSGLLLNTGYLYESNLKLNQDPGQGEADYLFLSKNCVAGSILDRYKSQELKSRIYKKVVVMPDVSDWSIRPENNKLGQQIRALAGNRLVVGTILLENEDAYSFFELAAHAPKEKYFFVCTGELEAATQNKLSRSAIQKLLIEKHQNNFISPMNLTDSTQVNSLINSFDICFLNDNQNHTPNNLLTKAAYFHKPVIGARTTIQGKLVETFKTGIAAGPLLSDNLEALEIFSQHSDFDKQMMDNYARLQSLDSLKEAWEQLLWF